MITTRRFTYIHQPKTGGSFVTDVLRELRDLLGTADIRVQRTFVPFVKLRVKHGLCSQIPDRHGKKQVLTCIRNPFDLYVSEYEFGWWKRAEYRKHFRRIVPGFEEKYPDFPELLFEDFVRLYNSAFCEGPFGRDFDDPRGGGWVTKRFVKYYYKHPQGALDHLDLDNTDWEDVRETIPNIHFLHTETLNQDLYDFLCELGYPEERLQFILVKGRVLPGGKGRSADQKWQRYYTPEFFEHIRQRERFLFHLFPEYDQPLINNQAADRGATVPGN